MRDMSRVVRAVEANAMYSSARDDLARAENIVRAREKELREAWDALTVAERTALTAVYHPDEAGGGS